MHYTVEWVYIAGGNVELIWSYCHSCQSVRLSRQANRRFMYTSVCW